MKKFIPYIFMVLAFFTCDMIFMIVNKHGYQVLISGLLMLLPFIAGAGYVGLLHKCHK